MRSRIWKTAYRAALVLGAVLVMSLIALALTVKEYSQTAVFSVEPAGGKADSLGLSVAERLKSPHIAKGAAISAMDGDYNRNLASYLADPSSKAAVLLRSYDPYTSVLAMHKFIACYRSGEIYLGYFSFDSIATSRTMDFFISECGKMSLKDIRIVQKSRKYGQTNLPWRSAALIFTAILSIWLLVLLISWIISLFARKANNGAQILKVSKDNSSIQIIGSLEDISSGRERYSNSLRRKLQAEDLANAIRGASGDSGFRMVNLIPFTKDALFKIRRSGVIGKLLEGCQSHLLEFDLQALSSAYRFPDIDLLKSVNMGNLLLMIHPPLSETSVPDDYLESASLNLLVIDAAKGWNTSYETLLKSIPFSQLLLVGMPPQSVTKNTDKRLVKARRLKTYLPSERRTRFIVLLSDSAHQKHIETTCKSLYYSTTGLSANDADNLLEVVSGNIEYAVRPFRMSSDKLLQQVKFTPEQADAVVMLKAGYQVSRNFLSDIADALYAGVECVQCKVTDSIGESINHRKLKRDSRRGLSCIPLSYGYAATSYAFSALRDLQKGQRPQFFVDYLEDTSVFFL